MDEMRASAHALKYLLSSKSLNRLRVNFQTRNPMMPMTATPPATARPTIDPVPSFELLVVPVLVLVEVADAEVEVPGVETVTVSWPPGTVLVPRPLSELSPVGGVLADAALDCDAGLVGVADVLVGVVEVFGGGWVDVGVVEVDVGVVEVDVEVVVGVVEVLAGGVVVVEGAAVVDPAPLDESSPGPSISRCSTSLRISLRGAGATTWSSSSSKRGTSAKKSSADTTNRNTKLRVPLGILGNR